MTLFYTVYEQADVIACTVRVHNGTQDAVRLQRADSFQLDLPGCAYTLYTLTGAWARERQAAPPCAGGRLLWQPQRGIVQPYQPVFLFKRGRRHRVCGPGVRV